MQRTKFSQSALAILSILVVTACGGGGSGGGGGTPTTTPTTPPTNTTPQLTTTNPTVALSANSSFTITPGQLQVTDGQSGPAAITFTMTAAPANGSLRKNGQTLGVNASFTQADINNGIIEFVSTTAGATSTSAIFDVTDADSNMIQVTLTINVSGAAVNTAPMLSTASPTLTLLTGATATVSQNILEVVDAQDGPGNLTYTVQSLPTQGNLMMGSTVLAVNGTFTQDDVENDQLSFVSTGTTPHTTSASFTVSDTGGLSINVTLDITVITMIAPAAISSVTPTQAGSNDFTQIEIGTTQFGNFSNQMPMITVGGQFATIVAINGQDITIRVPNGLNPGNQTIEVTQGSQSATFQNFQIMAAISNSSIIINEVLADGSIDANNDGATNSDDDEFVELVNTTNDDLDISGLRLLDMTQAIRHEFPSQTILPANSGLVVFSGGNPVSFAQSGQDGAAFTASTGTLSINNTSAETLTLQNPQGATIDEVSFNGTNQPTAPTAESLNRQTDVNATANLVAHTQATNAGTTAFSPGLRTDNLTNFSSAPVIPQKLIVGDKYLDILFELDQNSGQMTRAINPNAGLRGIGGVESMAAQSATVIYACDTLRDGLFRIDTASNTTVFVGALGFGRVRGLAFSSNGTLYGADDSTNALITIDLTTGKGTRVGSFGSGYNDVEGLAFDNNGQLFAIDNTDAELIRVNVSTGAATSVFSFSGSSINPVGLAFLQSTGLFYTIDMNSNQLYSLDPTNMTATAVGSAIMDFPTIKGLTNKSTTEIMGFSDGADKIITIDDTTGSASVMRPIAYDNFEGLAYDSANQRFFAVDISGNLVSVDKTTSNPTYIGTLTLNGTAFIGIQGLAFGNNTLYAVELGFGTTIPGQIYTVNTTTAELTALPMGIGFNNIQSLAYDSVNQTLYGIDVDAAMQLIEISPNTGAGSAVATLTSPPNMAIGSAIGSLAFVPGTTNTLVMTDDNQRIFSISLATANLGTVSGGEEHGFDTIKALGYDSDQGSVFGIDGTEQLLIFDSNDNAARTIGDEVPTSITGMCFNSNTNKILFADTGTAPAKLYSYDLNTKSAKYLLTLFDANLGVGLFVNGLAYDPQNDEIYAVDADSGNYALYKASLTSRVVTRIGGLSNRTFGLTFDPIQRRLYGAVDTNPDPILTRLNLSTAAETQVGSITSFNIAGLTFDETNNKIVGLSFSKGEVLDIDVNNGSPQVRTNTGGLSQASAVTLAR